MDKSVKVYFILGPFLMARSMWKMGFTLVGQMLKNLPAMQETQIWFPGLGRSPGEWNGNAV